MRCNYDAHANVWKPTIRYGGVIYRPTAEFVSTRFVSDFNCFLAISLEKTLWMGSIDSEKWDSNFITEAFGTFDFKVQNVKMVTEKGSDKV